MNKLNYLFNKKNKNILCIYFTAGYPKIDSTEKILRILQDLRVDLVEVGIPYSDPLADGGVIQNSNKISLKNGMNVSLLFHQFHAIKKYINIPIILMGYFNQIYQFGEKKFLKKCKESGISGLIIPDLPSDLFVNKYQVLFKEYSLSMIFLITPNTSYERILSLSKLTSGFLYLVSSNSITGNKNHFGSEQILFFQRIKKLPIKIPKLIGFGISDKKSFQTVCKYSNGGIIGSNFIQSIDEKQLEKSIKSYINSII
ncbi:tryptophan synthase subunit alpha [Blattabacterium cuenoti]|uniref:tryptophan synthase subunit alpha n=1 Tax=Blattabacterium cuenoti TaxID=1653831 RepID=UPI00163BB91C|nr:tryptophan synthase subunit alpha [Blattabacterium cuenoti]